MKKDISLIVILGTAFLLYGCGKADQKVLARVSNDVITLKEFNEKIEKLPKQYQEIARSQKRKFLDDIINEELLYKEALKAKVDKDPETQEVIEAAKRKIFISRILKNRIEDRVSVSEENIRKYYDEHSEEFMLPERWRASHILVDTQAEAEEVMERIKQGADFSELARNMSKDATSKQDGDVGYFSKGQLIPEFEKACFELEVGEVSDVVKTQFGYHVIKLTDKKSPEVQDFSNVKSIINKEMEREQKKELFEKMMADLKNEAKITVYEKLIADAPAGGVPEN